MQSSRRVFALIFFVSGFSGLIYESLWTHYLKLFLGHAAYAQTLVLAIFMGGLALGSEACSRASHRLGNLLRWYALAEAAVGALALVFAPLFEGFLDLAYGSVLPALGASVGAEAFKYSASALLILPQSFLLGATFPLMTAGLVRRDPDRSGETIATLYFVNSLGAAIGVLASGFLLVEWFGLQGTLSAAGVINLALAAIVWKLGGSDPLFVGATPVTEPVASDESRPRLLLVVALVTGAASFVYEVCWIRMLSMVLGNSTHSFELMLSAFITGLAFGGLWIRKRIDRLDNPIRFLAAVQIVMGMLALLTLPMYSGTFGVMQWLMGALDPNEQGYVLFNLSSHALALCVMLPTTFCAGTTLPLITHSLLRSGHGEKSIGRVYAWNTIGAILGVMVTVHVGFPMLGIKGSLVLGATLDIGLGLALVWAFSRARPVAVKWTVAGVSMLLVASLFRLDPLHMASGVYRQGELLVAEETEVPFHRAGKTATISLTKRGDVLSIRTNGKVDASLSVKGAVRTEDEITMVLLGAMPLVLRPDAKTAANIGMGSGLTTHTLLGSTELERVDTIEIEPVMAEAASQFGKRVARAFEDPRSHMHFDDAKAFFATARREYDIIVSEPSNPWVSGVASLFSEDFYGRVRTYLAEGGLFVQWIQFYEIDTQLVASILGALANNFEDFVVYAANRADIVLVASPSGRVPAPSARIFEFPPLAKELQRNHKKTLADLELHWIADRRALEPWIRSTGIRPNSNDHPVVDLGAARARFLRSNAIQMLSEDLNVVPVYAMLSLAPPSRPTEPVTISTLERSVRSNVALMLLGYFGRGNWSWPDSLPGKTAARRDADTVRRMLRSQPVPADRWMAAMLDCLAERVVPYVAPEILDRFWDSLPRPDSDEQRRFLDLLRAVSHRDAQSMAELGSAMLVRASELQQGLREYVVAVTMLGQVTLGDQAGARSTWSTHRDSLAAKARHAFRTQVLLAHSHWDGP
ncbi:MAG: fused MFS/spermidine synthase [Planctomycetes bacterium]|nr:fused MFS/spermidine synthase [Planctomycetota bacterium]